MHPVATFDQLPAEQRAIIELVVARGRSYDALADVLQVSPQRVRELAREALVELSPRTGKRVDPEWRGQVADYMLGQQSSAESTATQAHLKRDETSRTWALSLLDALDMLFENGNLPTVPDAEPVERPARRREAAEADGGDEPEAGADEEPDVEEPDVEDERPRKRERERERKGRARAATVDRDDKRDSADADADGARDGGGATTRERDRKRERERATARKRERDGESKRDRERERKREREKDRERERDRDEDERDEKAPVAGRSVLSPAAQTALRRRRVFGALGALALIAAIAVGVLALTGVFSGDDDGATSGGDSDNSAQTEGGSGGTDTPAGGQGQGQGQPRVLGQVPLKAQNGVRAQGVAYLLEQGSQRVLAVTARLPPLPANQRRAAYNVWLYNSPKDAASIGAQFTNAQGAYQGVGPLPGNYEKYQFIDVSVQPFNNKTGHSGNSVLRGALRDLKPVPRGQLPQGQGGAQPQPGQPQQPQPQP